MPGSWRTNFLVRAEGRVPDGLRAIVELMQAHTRTD